MALSGRKPAADERRYMAMSAAIPCLACAIFHGVMDTPAEVHHINGKTAKNAHLDVISLCARHHRHPDNERPPRWISRHGDGKKAFEERYMPEAEFLAEQKRRVTLMGAMMISGGLGV